MEKIYGHTSQIEGLAQAVRRGRLNHAYIFEGVDGIGKTMVAHHLARIAVCKKQDGAVCGICQSCQKSEAGSHPDIVTVDSAFIQDGKVKEGSVDAMRLFKRDVYSKPFLAQRKVYIIPQADQMLLPAQNSLLKVLEEPPSYCTVILLCENAQKLLETVRSRAVLLHFQPLNDRDMSAYLAARFGGEQVEELLRLAGGIPRRAEEIAGDEAFFERRSQAAGLFADYLCSTGDMLPCSRFLEGEKDRIGLFLDEYLVLMRDAVLAAAGEKGAKDDLSDYARKIAKKAGLDGAAAIFDILQETSRRLGSNANFSLTVTDMLLRSWERANG